MDKKRIEKNTLIHVYCVEDLYSFFGTCISLIIILECWGEKNRKKFVVVFVNLGLERILYYDQNMKKPNQDISKFNEILKI